MSENLEAHLRQHITQHGPIDVGQFMSIALCHPEHGYYMKQDPFGMVGDFTTSPEISQMFGEVIGAWVADVWEQMGRPKPFGLLECGPGRGTLMADILRVCANVEGFRDGALIHLLEISPTLKTMQSQALEGWQTSWYQTMASVPRSYPLIILGNEFFDTLPFRQLVKTADGWGERVVTADLEYGVRPAGIEILAHLPASLQGAKEGDVFEIAPARTAVMNTMCDLLSESGGAALMIDYGHDQSGIGDTFQAMRKHEYVDPLKQIGDADLTSHVDFQALEQVAKDKGASFTAITHQGGFLNAIGIAHRAEILMKSATEEQSADIKRALERLTNPQHMGYLFKVMGVCYGDGIKPAGF